MLSTRFRRLLVWLGVIAAFAVQCAIAVTAGGLLTLLPDRLVLAEQAGDGSRARVLATSFLVLFTAEWGDLSQLLTAGLAARTQEPLSVFVGAWTALALVAGIAVLIGGWLRRRLPLWRIRLISGSILAALAIWTLIELVRG